MRSSLICSSITFRRSSSLSESCSNRGSGAARPSGSWRTTRHEVGGLSCETGGRRPSRCPSPGASERREGFRDIMEALRHWLAGHELLLLVVVLLMGLMLGRLEWRGVRLGSAGVLFGAWSSARYCSRESEPAPPLSKSLVWCCRSDERQRAVLRVAKGGALERRGRGGALVFGARRRLGRKAARAGPRPHRGHLLRRAHQYSRARRRHGSIGGHGARAAASAIR
jgi:hypothetical protein